MKKILLLSCLSLILASPFAMATKTATALSPILDVSQKLEKAGYTNIREIEFKRGHFEVKAYDTQGKKLKFIVSPNGIVPPLAKPLPYLTMSQAIEKAQTAGYKTINEIEFEKGQFQLKTLDAQGKKVKLEMDAKTGSINID